MIPDPRVLHGLPADGLEGTVLSIGNFDGVHVGHRALLSRMRELADELGRPATAFSFFPTSRMVFQNSGFLSSAREKTLLLGECGADTVILQPFSREYAATDKKVFLKELAALRPAAILVGADFRFGRDRAGSLNDLSLVTDRLETFRLLEHGGEKVSSSRIRELLAAGDLEKAARLLGGPYLAAGRVVEGDRRGRTIGFPTANLEVGAGKVLPEGVFAVTVTAGDRVFSGMANAGPRPSFPDGAPALEVNLFDFSGDLYGSELLVRFVAPLRGQKRFDGLEALKAQLARDRNAAVAALGIRKEAEER